MKPTFPNSPDSTTMSTAHITCTDQKGSAISADLAGACSKHPNMPHWVTPSDQLQRLVTKVEQMPISIPFTRLEPYLTKQGDTTPLGKCYAMVERIEADIRNHTRSLESRIVMSAKEEAALEAMIAWLEEELEKLETEIESIESRK
jgi:hypothetical protein